MLPYLYSQGQTQDSSIRSAFSWFVESLFDKHRSPFLVHYFLAFVGGAKMNPRKKDQLREEDPSVLCLYHDDADGRCSAAIVRRFFGSSVRLQAIDYGDPVPWEIIEASDKVIIVDFSLPLEDMRRAQKTSELVWIDHHKTALEGLSELNDVAGMRSLEDAACVLTWRTFFPDQLVPKAVMYVGDRDIWRFAYDETAAFGEALIQEDTRPGNDKLWKPLLDDETSRVEEMIERGAVLYRARMLWIKHQIDRYGFEVIFEGRHTLAINARGSGEMGAQIRQLGYEIGYCYVEAEQNGELKTFVTLYSDRVDVSEIARKFGGGGHAGAAGFSIERTGSPFPPQAIVER
jgi:oligoribonuclease NrnB/cAMP/cGMP phosphodiesterase (DHH superfamily)